MMSLTRIDCPGFSVISRTMPLRLLSKPITAMRSRMGVVPDVSCEAGGSLACSTTPFSGTSSFEQAAKTNPAAAIAIERNTRRPESRLCNHRSR